MRIITAVAVVGATLFSTGAAHAQSCSGSLYLNPQVIRGESSSATNAAMSTLADILRPSLAAYSPVVSFKKLEDFVAASKRTTPPCAVYANPVIGFALRENYAPTAVNHDSITPAVVFMYGTHNKQDAPPEPISSLSPKEAQEVMAALKKSSCWGMAGGVTTALVAGSAICGDVKGLVPSEGRGQAFLPSHAAFLWSSSKPVGFITRDAAGAKATMKDRISADTALHQARLILIPATKGMLGYGLYLHNSLVGTATESKLQSAFAAIKPDKVQQVALDTDGSPNFRAVSAQDGELVLKSLAAYLDQQLKRAP